jgi:hypothetical protein
MQAHRTETIVKAPLEKPSDPGIEWLTNALDRGRDTGRRVGRSGDVIGDGVPFPLERVIRLADAQATGRSLGRRLGLRGWRGFGFPG